MSDEPAPNEQDQAETAATPEPPAPAPLIPNRFLPIVTAHDHQSLTLSTPLVAGGIIHVNRPKMRQHPKMRAFIRDAAAAEQLKIDDLDVYSYNLFNLGALFAYCVDQPVGGIPNWLDLSPADPDEAEGWNAVESEVFGWFNNFRDWDNDRRVPGAVGETGPADSDGRAAVGDGVPTALQPPAA